MSLLLLLKPERQQNDQTKPMLISLKDISRYKVATHEQMKSDSKEEFTKQKQI